MEQEKFGKIIKKIRKNNNLTQKEFADKYNVTYQAVSKWENGKNMPDTTLIKQISKDFDISLEDLFEGNLKPKKESHKKINILLILLLFIAIIIICILLFYVKKDDNNFSFNTLSSSCSNFELSGTIAYNDKKTSIYITNIKYCSNNDKEHYKKIECILYESHADIAKKISSYVYDENKEITLEEFLEKVTFSVDDYQKSCKKYSEDSLYLAINATEKNEKTTTYNIPLKLDKTC